jgi:hypothetical protein
MKGEEGIGEGKGRARKQGKGRGEEEGRKGEEKEGEGGREGEGEKWKHRWGMGAGKNRRSIEGELKRGNGEGKRGWEEWKGEKGKKGKEGDCA